MEYKLNTEISTKIINTEIFILNRETSKIHSFNDTGNCIWELLLLNKPISEFVEILTQKFNVSHKEAKKDLNNFLKQLEENKLIKFINKKK